MIDIQIRDDARYVLVATVVDQPKIEALIDDLRKRTGLDKQLVPYDNFSSRYKYISYKPTQEEQRLYDEMNDRYEMLRFRNDTVEKREFETLEKEILNWINPRYRMESRIREALAKFPYGDEFYDVLLKAIITGEARESDYRGRSSRERADKVKRDRNWYWQNKRLKGKERRGYLKISKLDKAPLQTVKTAIKSYQSRLDSLSL